MIVTIVSPKHKQDFDAQWVEFTTPVGTIMIQPEHAPFIALLQQGKNIRILDDNHNLHEFIAESGLASVTRTQVTIIIRS